MQEQTRSLPLATSAPLLVDPRSPAPPTAPRAERQRLRCPVAKGSRTRHLEDDEADRTLICHASRVSFEPSSFRLSRPSTLFFPHFHHYQNLPPFLRIGDFKQFLPGSDFARFVLHKFFRSQRLYFSLIAPFLLSNHIFLFSITESESPEHLIGFQLQLLSVSR